MNVYKTFHPLTPSSRFTASIVIQILSFFPLPSSFFLTSSIHTLHSLPIYFISTFRNHLPSSPHFSFHHSPVSHGLLVPSSTRRAPLFSSFTCPVTRKPISILAHCIQNADIASFFIFYVCFSCTLKSAECEWKKAYAYRVECANGSFFFSRQPIHNDLQGCYRRCCGPHGRRGKFLAV